MALAALRSMMTWQRIAVGAVALLLLVGATVVGTRRADAQSGPVLQVTRLDDPAPDGCSVGDCSLREAVIAASGQGGPTTVQLRDGVHLLEQARAADAEDTPEVGDLDVGNPDVRSAVVLQGAGVDVTAIDASPLAAVAADRAIEVVAGDLRISHLTVTGGSAPRGAGVAVAEGAALTVEDALVGGNAADGDGGGVWLDVAADLVLRRAEVLENVAGGFGGGVASAVPADGAPGADVQVEASTVADNVAARSGGGMQLLAGVVGITSSTISRNVALEGGGGLLLEDATSTIDASTLTANDAPLGAAVAPIRGDTAVHRTAIAGNAQTDCDLSQGGLRSLGGNAAHPSCGLAAGDLAITEPLLGPLQDNGGATETHLPEAASPLVDAAPSCPPTDQRGAARPADGDDDGDARCDVGAVERGAVPPAPPAPPAAAPVPTDDPTAPPALEDGALDRLAGSERVATSVAISREGFADGTAPVVVLARADEFADALAGTPLAIAERGPLLLTPPDVLRDDVAAEIQRVLAADGRVILLGGPAALSTAVEDAVTAIGVDVERIAGDDRFQTALRIATDGLGDPDLLVAASGADFPDAVAAGAATGAAGGAIVLTDGERLPESVAEFLADRPDVEVLAIGGPAAAAVPDARPLVGATRIETAIAVAAALFPDGAEVVGIATARDFPDALAGGALLGQLGGPVLLSEPEGLPSALDAHLRATRPPLSRILLLGGPAALSTAVEAAAAEVLR